MTLPMSIPFGFLAPLTVVPNPVDDTINFIQWANRFYEEIAFVANVRMIPYYTIHVTDTATDIPDLAQFGAFLVCVAGIDPTMPTKTWSLCKAKDTTAGSIAVLGSQNGSAGSIWSGISLTITSTATNFQIAHNLVTVPVTTGIFNISVIGTQTFNQ